MVACRGEDRWAIERSYRGGQRRRPLILLVAFSARLVVWLIGLANPESFLGGDSSTYWMLAENPIQSYSVTSGAEFTAGLLYPPGYPATLWLLRALPGDTEVAALGQLGIGVLCVWLTILVGQELLGNVVGAIAGWWVALDPLHVVESSMLLTDIPFSVALLAGLFAAAKALRASENRSVWWGVAGLALGVAALIRPIGLYLPAVLVGLVAITETRRAGWRKAATCSLALLLAAIVPTGLWVARNQQVSGVATFSTLEGLNLAWYRGAGALLEETGLSKEEAWSVVSTELEQRVTDFSNPAVVSSAETRLGVEMVLDHPVGYAVSAVKGMGRTLLGPGGAHIGQRISGITDEGAVMNAASFASAVSAAAAAFLTLIGSWRLIRKREWMILSVLGIPLGYLLVVGSGLESYSRFRLQFFPVLAIMASYALFDLVRRRRASQRE